MKRNRTMKGTGIPFLAAEEHGAQPLVPHTHSGARIVDQSVVVTPDTGLLPNDIALREEGSMPTPQSRYVITRVQDTLHINPREQCNTDDADLLQTVDAQSAHALLDGGAVVGCGHCVTAHEDGA